MIHISLSQAACAFTLRKDNRLQMSLFFLKVTNKTLKIFQPR